MIRFTLSDLAFAVYVFDALTNYNESYRSFRADTENNLDLTCPDHRRALMRWLNQWGCRQFATAHHVAALKNIVEWHDRVAHRLVDCEKEIWELNDDDLKVAEDAYCALSQVMASKRTTNLRTVPVTIGPTGASKILFALRPRAYIPWDQAIRDSLQYSDDGAGYSIYLRDAKLALRALEQSCIDSGFTLKSLPCQLGKPGATVALLVNAYLWIVYSQGCKPPGSSDLSRWAKWGL